MKSPQGGPEAEGGLRAILDPEPDIEVVGCAVTGVLRERGFDARFLRGGLSAWYAAGGSRALRPEPVVQGV